MSTEIRPVALSTAAVSSVLFVCLAEFQPQTSLNMIPYRGEWVCILPAYIIILQPAEDVHFLKKQGGELQLGWDGKAKSRETKAQSTASLMQWHPLNRLKWARKTNRNLKAQCGAMDPGFYIRIISYKGNKPSFDLHYSPCHPLQWCCQAS